MQYSLPKKWRTLSWVGIVLLVLDMLVLSAGVNLGGGSGGLFLVCGLVSLGALALVVVCSLKLRCPACGRLLDREALRPGECFFCSRCGSKIYLE